MNKKMQFCVSADIQVAMETKLRRNTKLACVQLSSLNWFFICYLTDVNIFVFVGQFIP